MGLQQRLVKLENRPQLKSTIDENCTCAAMCRFHSVKDVQRLTNETCAVHGLRYYNVFIFTGLWVVELAKNSGDPARDQVAALDISPEGHDFATGEKIMDQLFAEYDTRTATHPMKAFFLANNRASAQRRSKTELQC